jgi:hypothetical protein
MKPPFSVKDYVDCPGLKQIVGADGIIVASLVLSENAAEFVAALNAATEKPNYPSLWCNGECLGEWKHELPNADDALIHGGKIFRVSHREFNANDICIFLVERGKTAKVTVIEEADHAET